MSVINGTPGADALNGTALGDQINGGAGDDVIRGFGGADTLNGGAGADRFIWNAGDGSDKVEGGADSDTAFFVGDSFVVSAGAAGHALATNLGETLDLHGVETLNIHGAAPGASFTLGDLSATDIRQVVIGLDAGANTVALAGAATGEVFEVQTLSGGTLRVFDAVGGVLQTIVASKLDAADQVTLDAGGGNDVITLETSAGVVSAATISAHGGAGADTLTGSASGARLFGDAGDDRIVSGGGADTIDGGAGNDVQVIGGGDGVNAVDLRAANGHLRATVGGVTSDAVNVETLIVRTLAQGDTVTVGDLTSTQVRTVNLDLSSPSGDGQADTVILAGAAAGTEVTITTAADGSSLQAVYAGAATQTVTVSGFDAADSVRVAGGDGADNLSTTAFASKVRVLVDGGAGDNQETFSGTAGSDLITVATNGSHVELTLNGSAPLDLSKFQHLVLNALGGADTVAVGDLSATDVHDVVVNLGGAGTTPDGQADLVTLDFSVAQASPLVGHFLAGSNQLQLTGSDGRSATVTNFEAQDRVVVNLNGSGTYTLHGDFGHTEFQLGATQDTVDWTLSPGQHDHNTINGGAGSDTLEIGFDGADRRVDQGGWVIGVLNNTGHTQLSMQHHSLTSAPDVATAVEVVDFERVNVFGGAGSDLVLVTDQTGTGLKFLNINIGGAGPDEFSDFVTIDGTSGADVITAAVAGEAGELKLIGLPETIDIFNLRSGDQFTQDYTFIRAGNGDDLLDFTNHFIGRGLVDLDGGAGNDTMIGGAGAERYSLKAGGGADVIQNFSAHALGGEADTLFVEGYTSFADLKAQGHIFQSGLNVVVLEGDGSSMTLTNVSLTGQGALTADDFLFG